MDKKLWVAALGAAATAAGYATVVRPRLLTLGATDAEVTRRMIGDRLIENPNYVTTRAITVDTSPQQVWPWLVQIGERRGGFYTFDVLDRLVDRKIHSPHRVLPRYQDLDVGDTLDRNHTVVVRGLEPGEALLIEPARHRSDITAMWTLALYPDGPSHTRLVSRVRARFDLKSPAAVVAFALTDPGQLILERKFLREVKAHAEGRSEKWPSDTERATLH